MIEGSVGIHAVNCEDVVLVDNIFKVENAPYVSPNGSVPNIKLQNKVYHSYRRLSRCHQALHNTFCLPVTFLLGLLGVAWVWA